MNYHLLIFVSILSLRSAQCDSATPKLTEVFAFYKEWVKPFLDLAAFNLKNCLPIEYNSYAEELVEQKFENMNADNLNEEQIQSFFGGALETGKCIQYKALLSDRASLKINTAVPNGSKTLEELLKLTDKVEPSIKPALDELKQFQNTEDCLNALSAHIESLQITVPSVKTAISRSAGFYIDFCLQLKEETKNTQ